jgi:hypothetical protein
MRSIFAALAASFVALTLVGCGPIRSTVGMIQADQVLKEARELGAEEVAPYPMQMAERLLEKAFEEQNNASYDTSWQLATEAKELAQTAIDLVPTAEGPIAPPPATGEEYDGIEDASKTPGRTRIGADEPPLVDQDAQEAPVEDGQDEPDPEDELLKEDLEEGEDEGEDEPEEEEPDNPWSLPPKDESP